MKNRVITLLVTIMIVTFPSTIVNAKSDSILHQTQNGITMENEVYQKLCDIYSKNYIETISYEEYELIMFNNLNNIEIKNYFDPEIITRGSYFSTNAKTIRIVKNGNYITLMATWKGVPTIKSYDVIAVRLNNVSLNGGYTFKQTYVVNNNLNVSYDSYKQNFSNGFGSSFKVQNGTSLEISLTFMISGSGTVYGSYQHASTATTLSESKKYTISHLGYGKVIKFDNNVQNKYDAMTGVDLNI